MEELLKLSRSEIYDLAEQERPKYIYFENYRKGDIIDDGYTGCEVLSDGALVECTACGARWDEEGHRRIHKKKSQCPYCHNNEITFNKKLGRKSMKEHSNFVVISVENENSVWAECLRINLEDYTDIYEPERSYQRRALYHFTPGGGIKYLARGYNWEYEPTKVRTGYHFNVAECTIYSRREEYNVLYKGNISESFMKYALLEQFPDNGTNGDILAYMMLYCKAPVFCEFFMKLRVWDPIIMCLEHGAQQLSKNIKLRANTIQGLFPKLSKAALKLLVKYFKREKPNTANVNGAVNLLSSGNTDLFRKITELFDRYPVGEVAQIISETNQSPVTFSNYLKKQGNQSIGIYSDYISECKQLEYDLSDTAVLYPKNLREKHNETSALCRYKTDPVEMEKSVKRCKKLKADGFEYCHKRLSVKVPLNSVEIIREGAYQGHCVGGYTKRHAAGETTILFIRKNDNLLIPYFTLEIDHKTGRVKQCYGKRNAQSYKDNLEVYQFLEHYGRHLEYCRKNKARKGKKTA